jgi:hypothetical protein
MSDNSSGSQTKPTMEQANFPDGDNAPVGEGLRESTRQFALIIVHLFIAVIAFMAAGVYVKFLLESRPPNVNFQAVDPNIPFFSPFQWLISL